MRRVLLAEPHGFSARALELLKSVAEVTATDIAVGELAAAMRDYDAVWVRLNHRLDAETIAAAGRCKLIACPVTGLDHIDLEACAAAGIRVIALKGEVDFLKQVRATAELTLALTLALMRQLVPAAQSVRDGHWSRDEFQGRELLGKTVGIVGVGRLGSITASYFTAFGCHVVGFDKRDDFAPQVERVMSLEELAARADIVSVHLSLDASTRRIIGGQFFNAMRPGGWFINTSRGEVVDEAALLAALKQGRLAGAALDVLTQEPNVDATHPVLAYAKANRNVLVVPHIGGNTAESFEKTEVFIASRLAEALRS